MFYLNTIEQLFLFVEQLDQLEVCLSNIILLPGIQILVVFHNFRWNSIKTSLCYIQKVATKHPPILIDSQIYAFMQCTYCTYTLYVLKNIIQHDLFLYFKV